MVITISNLIYLTSIFLISITIVKIVIIPYIQLLILKIKFRNQIYTKYFPFIGHYVHNLNPYTDNNAYDIFVNFL